MNSTTEPRWFEISPLKELSATTFLISYFWFLKTFYPPIFYLMCLFTGVTMVVSMFYWVDRSVRT